MQTPNLSNGYNLRYIMVLSADKYTHIRDFLLTTVLTPRPISSTLDLCFHADRESGPVVKPVPSSILIAGVTVHV